MQGIYTVGQAWARGCGYEQPRVEAQKLIKNI